MAYPYWCLEKGYAKWTGPREESTAWVERARGWIRVLHWDAILSAVVYTFATVAFYLLGAAVLGRANLNPAGTQMIRTLAEMYVPVFGETAHVIFLFGAIAVLYSTFFVGSAGHTRVMSDALRVFGLVDKDEATRQFWIRVFSVLMPSTCFVIYAFVQAPVVLILLSGVTQAVMLPMLAYGALYFRYRGCHPALRPGRWWGSVSLVVERGPGDRRSLGGPDPHPARLTGRPPGVAPTFVGARVAPTLPISNGRGMWNVEPPLYPTIGCVDDPIIEKRKALQCS